MVDNLIFHDNTYIRANGQMIINYGADKICQVPNIHFVQKLLAVLSHKYTYMASDSHS